MDLGFEANARHPYRLADTFLVVDDEFLGKDVQYLLVCRNRDRSRRVDDAIDIARTHLAVADGNDAVRIQASYVAAGNARIYRVDVATCHQLGFFDGALYRVNRRLDIDDHSLFQAARRMRADSDDLDFAAVPDLAHDRDDLGCTDIQPDDQIFFRPLAHSSTRPANIIWRK